MPEETLEGEFRLADEDCDGREKERAKERAKKKEITDALMARISSSAVTADTFYRFNNKCMLIKGVSCNNGDCRVCNFVGFKLNYAKSLMYTYEKSINP